MGANLNGFPLSFRLSWPFERTKRSTSGIDIHTWKCEVVFWWSEKCLQTIRRRRAATRSSNCQDNQRRKKLVRITPLVHQDVLSRRTDRLPTLRHLACHSYEPLSGLPWQRWIQFTAFRTQLGLTSFNMPAPSRRSYSKRLASTWLRIQT